VQGGSVLGGSRASSSFDFDQRRSSMTKIDKRRRRLGRSSVLVAQIQKSNEDWMDLPNVLRAVDLTKLKLNLTDLFVSTGARTRIINRITTDYEVLIVPSDETS
jgi:hypothetical protein